MSEGEGQGRLARLRVAAGEMDADIVAKAFDVMDIAQFQFFDALFAADKKEIRVVQLFQFRKIAGLLDCLEEAVEGEEGQVRLARI